MKRIWEELTDVFPNLERGAEDELRSDLDEYQRALDAGVENPSPSREKIIEGFVSYASGEEEQPWFLREYVAMEDGSEDSLDSTRTKEERILQRELGSTLELWEGVLKGWPDEGERKEMIRKVGGGGELFYRVDVGATKAFWER